MPEAPRIRNPSGWAFIALLGAAMAVLWCRLRLLALPLERDEGEYALMARVILEGLTPYVDAYSMKLPGIHAVYALILSLFGNSDSGIRFALLLVNLFSTLGIFLIGSKISGRACGCWCAAIFLIGSASPTVLGITANAEHFALLPLIYGVLLVLEPMPVQRRPRAFMAGMLWGSAVLIKQQSLFFIIPAFVWAITQTRQGAHRGGGLVAKANHFPWLLLLLGMGAMGALLLAWAWVGGFLKPMWFWCIEYAWYYGSNLSNDQRWTLFKMGFGPFARQHLLILFLAGSGILLAILQERKTFWFLITIAIAGTLAVLPGFIFRPHYFIFILPPLALAAGYSLTQLPRAFRWTGVLALAIPVAVEWQTFFKMSPEEVSKRLYPSNAFHEAKQLGLELGKQPVLAVAGRQPGKEPIGILGSEPQLAFYAGRPTATPFLYMYPMLEPQPFAAQMQKEFIERMGKTSPEICIHFKVRTSWLVYPESNTAVLTWMMEFLKTNYVIEKTIPVPHLPQRQEIVIYRRK
jgi:hypothetical protein